MEVLHPVLLAVFFILAVVALGVSFFFGGRD